MARWPSYDGRGPAGFPHIQRLISLPGFLWRVAGRSRRYLIQLVATIDHPDDRHAFLTELRETSTYDSPLDWRYSESIARSLRLAVICCEVEMQFEFPGGTYTIMRRNA